MDNEGKPIMTGRDSLIKERKEAGKELQQYIDSGNYKLTKFKAIFFSTVIVTISLGLMIYSISLFIAGDLLDCFFMGIFAIAFGAGSVIFINDVRDIKKFNSLELQKLKESRDALLKGEEDPHRRYGASSDREMYQDYDSGDSSGGYD